MSDSTYSHVESDASENYVTVAQTVSPRLILTKRNYASGEQASYDRVKHFNFFERRMESLDQLYQLCKELLDKPRCCLIRARIKDLNNRRNVVRKCVGADATLVVGKCNWFALDIDGLDGYTGDLLSDLNTALLALPPAFQAECFAVASASYGFFKKPGIHMKLFYWSLRPISHIDLKRSLAGNKAKADLAIFNPIQLIYVAKPFWHGMDDPIKERIVYFPYTNAMIDIPSYETNKVGAQESYYTKRQSVGIIVKSFERIAELKQHYRHDGLIREGYLGGHLCYQGFLDEEEALDRLALVTNEYWIDPPPNPEKDRATYLYAFRQGIKQMEEKAGDVF